MCYDNYSAQNLEKKKRKNCTNGSAYIFCQGQTVQHHSSSVAFRGANKIIQACVLVPQTSPLKMLWGAGVGPCVLHHKMS